jgi:hypothetical protein
MINAPIPFEQDAAFAQVDGRDYIQGVTILHRMLEATLPAGEAKGLDPDAGVAVKRIKFTRNTLCDGVIRGLLGADKGLEPAGAVAQLLGTLDGQALTAAYYPDEARPVSRQESSPPYPIHDFEPLEGYGGRWRFAEAGDGGVFLWALIEANKRTIRTALGERMARPRIELVEASDFLYRRHGMMADGALMLETLSVREFGPRLYILNEARYTDADGAARSLRLQYSANPA